MKTILHEANQYVLRFDRGEDVIESFKRFCQDEKITSGFFYGLGACTYLKLAFYNLETKQYQDQEYNSDLEIATITGNIAMFENDLVIHMHGTFSDPEMKTMAGHVSALKAGGTCEIFLTKFDQAMTREFDPDTGLKLLK